MNIIIIKMFVMRLFITVLVLIFSLQSLTKADDIRDFEIEGMSIGDSLLDYFKQKKIKDQKKFVNLAGVIRKEYSYILVSENLENYEQLAISFKSDDTKYIIQGITGRMFYGQNISQCYNDMNSRKKEIKTIIKKFKITDIPKKKLKNLPNGNSYVTKVGYFVKGGVIGIQCYDYSKEAGDLNHLRFSMNTIDYRIFLSTKAYK